MANIIKPKRSSVAGKVPTTSDIVSGEIAINNTDQKIYTNNGSTVVQIGGGKLSALADVAITSPTTNQILKYDGTNWINSTGGGGGSGDVVGPASSTDNALVRFDGTTGLLIQNGNITQDDNGNLSNVNGITFDTTPTSAPTATGSVFWDSGNQSPSVILNADTTLQLGQENIALVYNGTGSTITAGSVVAVNGAQGQRPSVALADADSEPLSAGTLGVATEDIANGAEGFICTFGLVRGLDTSAFTAGQPIWLSSTAGQFTATRPPAPAHTVFLGWVIFVNASAGEIFVHISNGWELDELHNVLITSPTSGNTLIYDATAGVWKNANLTDGTGITITEGAGSITVANAGVLSNVAGTGISVSGATGNVTITNTAPDQTVVLTAGTGISTSGTYPNFTITNSAPDQVVALTGSGGVSITGTYPNFTVTGTTYSLATSTTLGLIELGSDTVQTTAANAVTSTADRTYALQVNSAGQAVVNVPWSGSAQVYPGAGIAVSTGTAWGTSKTSPTGDIVGTTDAQTLTNKQLQAYNETVTTVGTVSTSTYNINLSLSNIFDITLGTNVTFTFTNAPSSGIAKNVTIILRQDGSGNRTASFTNAKYTDGTAPILSTGANQIDVLTFFTVNGGSFWFGTFAMANVS
jgi:hypothetical protein